MIEKVYAGLLRKTRKTLASGKVVAIVGWMAKNHDEFTRRLPDDRVVFLESSQYERPLRVGLAIFIRFTSHSQYQRFRANGDTHASVTNSGVVRRLLRGCKDIIFPSLVVDGNEEIVQPKLVSEPAMVQSIPNDIENNIAREEVVGTILTSKTPEQNLDQFIQAFLDAVKSSKRGLVSKMTLANLRRQHGIKETVHQLALAGLVEPIVVPGKVQVSWYKPGPEMLSFGGDTVLDPADSDSKVEAFIAEEAKLLIEQKALEQRLEKIIDRLDKIRQIRELKIRIEEKIKELTG